MIIVEDRERKNEIAASFIANIHCRIGIHQGEWTTEGCQQRRFCMFCGKPQHRERHNWPLDSGEYFKDGSCYKEITCLRCGRTKVTGKVHEGRISSWNAHCRRCGEDLGEGDWD